MRAFRSRSAARCSAVDPRRRRRSHRDCATCSSHRITSATYYSTRFMGFFIVNPDSGRVLEPVPAPLSGVDCHRLRRERPDRRAAGDAARGRCSAWSRSISPARACSGARAAAAAARAARAQRDRGVVRALSERRGRGAGAAVRRAARLVAGAGGRPAVLRPGRRVAARHAALPALRHGAGARRLRRRGGDRPRRRTAARRRLLRDARRCGSRSPRSICSA